MRRKESSKRILIGFVEIGGYHGALARGFRQLGHTCNFYEFRPHPFQYSQHRAPLISRLIIGLLEFRKKHTSKLFGVPITAARILIQSLFFLYATIRYDVFIFGFGTTFFTPITPSLERFRIFGAKFLVRIGKRVIFLMQGSDARPPFMDGTYQNRPLDEIKALNAAKRQNMKNLENTGASVVCDRAISAYFTRPVIDRSFILCPANTENTAQTETLQSIDLPAREKTVTILHAPSAPELKGSQIIRDTIQRIQIPGINIRFVEIRDKSNSEVIEHLKQCDLIIDQLYSDIVLPVFPTEAGWLGKPAVIGIYDKAFVLDRLTTPEIPPAWYIHPEDLEKELTAILRLPTGEIQSMGKAIRQFIQNNATEERVAQKFLRIIHNDIPHEWRYDPKCYNYLNGCVIREERLFANIKSLIDKYGISSLCMDDKERYNAQLRSKGLLTENYEK